MTYAQSVVEFRFLQNRPLLTNSRPTQSIIPVQTTDNFEPHINELQESQNDNEQSFWSKIGNFFKRIWNGIKSFFKRLFGGSKEISSLIREELQVLRQTYNMRERRLRFENLFRKYATSQNAEVFFTAAAELTPDFAIEHYRTYRHLPSAREILRCAVERDPISGKYYSNTYQNEHPEIFRLADNLHNHITNLRSFRIPQQREQYLRENVLGSINPYLISALDTINRETNLALTCENLAPASINRPCEFVFIHSRPNEPPIRISLTYSEIANKSTEELVRTFRDKINTQISSPSRQYAIWNRRHNFDLPQRGTSLWSACVPGHLTGIETDYYALLRDVYLGRYRTNIRGICMQNQQAWQVIHGGSLPSTSQTSRNDILRTLGESCDQAIEAGDTDFVMHCTWHGLRNGMIQTSTGTMAPEELAQVLAANGRSRRLNITFVLESCYSESQIRRIVSYFRENRIPVKSLRVIASSDLHTPSFAGSGIHNSSLINPRIGYNYSGTLAYYLSYFFQRNPQGTFADACRFTDIMARYDSPTNQDMVAIHYHTDEISNRPYEEQFSRINQPSEETPLQNIYRDSPTIRTTQMLSCISCHHQ